MSSASVGFWPSDRMTVPSSLVVMVPGRERKERPCWWGEKVFIIVHSHTINAVVRLQHCKTERVINDADNASIDGSKGSRHSASSLDQSCTYISSKRVKRLALRELAMAKSIPWTERLAGLALLRFSASDFQRPRLPTLRTGEGNQWRPTHRLTHRLHPYQRG